MKNLFIGIDFSKETFDVSFFGRETRQQVHHSSFENVRTGYIAMLRWIGSQTDVPRQEWLFCGEHTGLYSIGLSDFLIGKGLEIWLENPNQIKLSSGIKREKSDPADSLAIAEYAMRFEDKCRLYEGKSKIYRSLKSLFNHRSRIVEIKKQLLTAVREERRVMSRNTGCRFVYEHTMAIIDRLSKEIKATEKMMKSLLEKSAEMKENYSLATSVVGISFVNAMAIIIVTENFTRFASAGEFACYSGTVPFHNDSGKIKDRCHISRIANIKIKVLLTEAAQCAMVYDAELRDYTERKLKQGKDKRLIINNIRNKLILRVFSVVRNKRPYIREKSDENGLESMNVNMN